MKRATFQAKIELNTVNPFVPVSGEQAALLKKDWRKPLPVIVRVNGTPAAGWKINLIPTGKGDFFLYLNGELRKDSQTKVGDRVSVEMEFDETYRSGPIHPIPELFRTALKQNPEAERRWNALVPSRQKEVLRYLAKLKTLESLARNTQRAVDALSGGKSRFLGRLWTASA